MRILLFTVLLSIACVSVNVFGAESLPFEKLLEDAKKSMAKETDFYDIQISRLKQVYVRNGEILKESCRILKNHDIIFSITFGGTGSGEYRSMILSENSIVYCSGKDGKVLKIDSIEYSSMSPVQKDCFTTLKNTIDTYSANSKSDFSMPGFDTMIAMFMIKSNGVLNRFVIDNIHMKKEKYRNEYALLIMAMEAYSLFSGDDSSMSGS